MSPRIPQTHSPLRALVRTTLIWVGLPAVAIAAIVYGIAKNEPSDRRAEDRLGREMLKKHMDMAAPDNARIEARRQELLKDPVAVRNDAEIMAMTPEQRRKRMGELEEDARTKRGY